MTITAIVGTQFGDEGKGHVVDYLARKADLVVRFQGGDNAGHTIVNKHGTFALHLIPSGIFYPETTCLIGTGTVVNPDGLIEELDMLHAAGVQTDKLFLSDRAQMVMPYHGLLDEIEEEARGGAAIGTTMRGIGPAYADKAARTGLRLGDLKHPDWLQRRLQTALRRVNRMLAYWGATELELEPLLDKCTQWAAHLGERIIDPLPLMRSAVETNSNVLLEGQLGVMRDLDWGTYPYVTSSNPTAAFAAVGAGLPPQAIERVVGVAKAYSTAVGAGPFPAELHDKTGERLREIGKEYGATTGRPRRTGWFDAVAVRHAAWLNGLTGLSLTKLDVLDSFTEIEVCTAYRLPDDSVIDYVPDTAVLEGITPIMETHSGWQSPTTGARAWDDLPDAAKRYLERLQELVGVTVELVSVGPGRDEIFSV